MTRLILPGMVRKKKGIVINVSSNGSNRALPLFTVYSAGKVMTAIFPFTNLNAKFNVSIIVYTIQRYVLDKVIPIDAFLITWPSPGKNTNLTFEPNLKGALFGRDCSCKLVYFFEF